MALGKQVRKYRDLAGWKLETLSFKSGVDVGTINALENRDSTRSKYASQLAKAFGLTLDQLLDEDRDYVLSTGEGEMVLAGGALPGQAVRAHDAGEPLSDAYIQIPENAVRFAAGNGRTALFDEVADSVPRTYRRDWFIKEGINPQQARCFKVDGDSMEELLFDGDSVLVNLAETQILNGKVYALRYGDELRIKRVYRKLDGSLILHSDNPAFVPREEEIPAAAVEQHIGIIGRVRDKSGRGGL